MPRTLAQLGAVSDRQKFRLLHEALDPADLLDVGTVLWMIANYTERYDAPQYDGVYKVDRKLSSGNLSQSVKDAMHRVQALNASGCRDEIVAHLLPIQWTISQAFSTWTGDEFAVASVPAL